MLKKRKMTHNVKVQTHPNGYSLDVDGTGYMYYTLAELVEGFLVHVGLGIVDYCDADTMRDLITACGTFPKEGQAIQAVAELQAKTEALEQAHYRDTRNIATLKNRLAQSADEMAKIQKRLKYYVGEEEQNKKAEKAKAEEDADEPKKKKDWKKGRLHKSDAEPKKKIKVKPSDKPVDITQLKTQAKQKKESTKKELEDRLRKRGVIV